MYVRFRVKVVTQPEESSAAMHPEWRSIREGTPEVDRSVQEPRLPADYENFSWDPSPTQSHHAEAESTSQPRCDDSTINSTEAST